ncbi:hypothetical protein [uncultured Eubacterium sp.]|uniref:hypothetical protein n=1 Tax=uncultured Eubacterium sp. TaxID=165185 RepID=UPI0025F7F124|nr:hypothetical protein [uncultured Eubacterium sp.]
MRKIKAFFIIALSIAITVSTAVTGFTAYSYDDSMLTDTSWTESENAVTKSVSYETENGIAECTISYLIDENNSCAYFQVLAVNAQIKKSSSIQIEFNIDSDTEKYSFYVDKDGVKGSTDVCKKFGAGCRFFNAQNTGSGIYVVALDVKTKALENRMKIALCVDNVKFNLIDGVTLNKITATKKPTTTKVKATRANKTQYSADGITVEKGNANNPEKEDKSTKFTASHKYTTANSKSDSSVTKYRASGILSTEKSGAVPETASQIIYNPKISDNAKGKRQILILTGGILGAVGLLLIGFSAGHLNAEKKKSKENTEEETSLNDEDDFEF